MPNDGHLTATERANNQAAFAAMTLAQLHRCYEDGKQYVRLYPDVPCYQEQQELCAAAMIAAEKVQTQETATMTDADRNDAFDVIQQLRGELMLRDAITPADLTPTARRTIETPCRRLVIIPAVAIEHALDQLTRLNALVALI